MPYPTKRLFFFLQMSSCSHHPISWERGDKETKSISSIGKFGNVSIFATAANPIAKTTTGCWRKLKASGAKDISPGVALAQDSVPARSFLLLHRCLRSFVSQVKKEEVRGRTMEGSFNFYLGSWRKIKVLFLIVRYTAFWFSVFVSLKKKVFDMLRWKS